MRKSTEKMTIKNFMARNYHQDALGAVTGICFVVALPAYYIAKLSPVAAIAFKVAAPVLLAL